MSFLNLQHLPGPCDPPVPWVRKPMPEYVPSKKKVAQHVPDGPVFDVPHTPPPGQPLKRSLVKRDQERSALPPAKPVVFDPVDESKEHEDFLADRRQYHKVNKEKLNKRRMELYHMRKVAKHE